MENDRLKNEIRARMTALGYTQKSLALRAGLSATYVRDILKVRSRSPKSYQLRQVAEVLNCSLMDLLGDTDSGQWTPGRLLQAARAWLAEVSPGFDLANSMEIDHRRWAAIEAGLEPVPDTLLGAISRKHRLSRDFLEFGETGNVSPPMLEWLRQKYPREAAATTDRTDERRGIIS